MSKLIPVQYHNKHYPEEIVPTIREVAGHFDKNSIDASGEKIGPMSLYQGQFISKQSKFATFCRALSSTRFALTGSRDRRRIG